MPNPNNWEQGAAVALPISISEILSLVDLLRQSSNSLGNNSLAPRTRSGITVPSVRALKVGRATNNISGSQFVLTWESPEDNNVAYFNIYVSGLSNTSPGSLTLIGGSKDSPASVQVNEATSGTKITFVVQTVLKNGHSGDLLLSPAVSAVVGASTNTAGEADFVGVSTTSATSGAGTLPANPAGFLKVKVDGASKRVPYYNP